MILTKSKLILINKRNDINDKLADTVNAIKSESNTTINIYFYTLRFFFLFVAN